MTETYVTESNELFSSFLLLYQALYLIIPLLILVHIILLWIALRRIIRSQIESTEKLVYTIIALFFTFFGPIIYLTTGKR
nr:PLD nuclease N-terminal domain-containing protein [Salegentibacter tibetensis]